MVQIHGDLVFLLLFMKVFVSDDLVLLTIREQILWPGSQWLCLICYPLCVFPAFSCNLSSQFLVIWVGKNSVFEWSIVLWFHHSCLVFNMQTLSGNGWNYFYAIQAIQLYLPFAPDIDPVSVWFEQHEGHRLERRNILAPSKLHGNKTTVSEDVVYSKGFTKCLLKEQTCSFHLYYKTMLMYIFSGHIVLPCLMWPIHLGWSCTCAKSMSFFKLCTEMSYISNLL